MKAEYRPPVEIDTGKKVEEAVQKEEQRIASPITPIIKPLITNKLTALKGCVDDFINSLAQRRMLSSKERERIQIAFMDAIWESVTLTYAEYVPFMEHLIGTIQSNKKVFNMANKYALIQDIPKTRKSDEQKQKYMNYIEAVVVMANNMSQRHRVGALVDIPMLSKGLHPRAAANINTYFSAVYS